MAIGSETKSESFASFSIGRFNVGGGNASSWINTDPLFEIGIGTSSSAPSNAFTVLKNGKIGIGTNTTTYRVEINSETGENPLKVKINNSGKLTVFSNGGTSIGTDATAPANGLLVSGDIRNTGGLLHSSDKNFKKNITPIRNALKNLRKISGVSYNWKVDKFPKRNFTDIRQIGVIAQEVEKVFPELVRTGEDGYKSVDYTKLSAILIEAVKEQQIIIEGLIKQNTELSNKHLEDKEVYRNFEERLKTLESLFNDEKITHALK
jgi:hypothetical protein